MIMVLTIEEPFEEAQVCGIYKDVKTAQNRLKAIREDKIAENKDWFGFKYIPITINTEIYYLDWEGGNWLFTEDFVRYRRRLANF